MVFVCSSADMIFPGLCFQGDMDKLADDLAMSGWSSTQTKRVCKSSEDA